MAKVKAWTKEESMVATRNMKKRNPKMKFRLCPICGTFGVVMDKQVHPTCEEPPVKRKKNAPDPNQGTLLPEPGSYL